jgi:hypothetical protein
VLSYFRSQQPAAIAFFVLLFWLIKLPFFFMPHIPQIPGVHSMMFDAGIFFISRPALSIFMAQICLLAQAIIFNYLFHRADYQESNTMIPAVYFTLITSVVPEFNYFSIYHLLVFLWMLLFYIFLQITSRESARVESYNAGFVAGILVVLMPQLVLFIPFLLLILYVLKTFHINEYFLLLMGVATPLYVVAGLNYLLGYPVHFSIYWQELFYQFSLERDLLNIILLVLTGVYLLFSFVSLRGILFSVGFKRRKNVNMTIWYLLGMAAVITGSGSLGIPAVALLWIPASIFLSLLILRARRKKVAEILHAVFVLTIFIINIMRIAR